MRRWCAASNSEEEVKMMISKVSTPRSVQNVESYLRPTLAASVVAENRRGREVVVQVAGVYNGASHRHLPHANVGDVIRVAGGEYAQSLIADGYVADPVVVEPVIVAEQPVLPIAVEPESTELVGTSSGEQESFIAEPVPAPWLDLVAAGLTDSLAEVAWNAGLKVQEDVTRLYQEEGLNGLLSIHGIGSQSARRLLRWAGIKV
jgi:hypothetical protein